MTTPNLNQPKLKYAIFTPNWLRRLAQRLQNSEAFEVRENPIIHYFPDVGHDGEITIDCVITPCAGSDLYDPALLEQRERIGKGVARQRVGAMVVELDKYGLHMRWKPGQSFDDGFLSPFSTPPGAKPTAEPPKERRDDGEFARRLVACWNACEGLDTETLETAATGPNAKEWFEAWLSAKGGAA